MSMKAYAHLMLYQMYFSSVLETKLLNESGVHIICVNPGIVKTNVVCLFTMLCRLCYQFEQFGFKVPDLYSYFTDKDAAQTCAKGI